MKNLKMGHLINTIIIMITQKSILNNLTVFLSFLLLNACGLKNESNSNYEDLTNKSNKSDTAFLESNTEINQINKQLHLETLKRDTVIDNYSFELIVENWSPETYYGNSTLVIKNLISGEIIQILKSDNFHFNQHLYFDFKDMNFDSNKDLVFFNGFNGGYGTQTYDYYLFNKKVKKFELNNELGIIAGCLGIKVDTVNKRIVSYAKGSCCWHETKAFLAKDNQFVEVKSLIIDQDSKNEIILKEKINGKWKTTLIPLIGDNNEDIIDSINKVF
jgi:hypothetical protein